MNAFRRMVIALVVLGLLVPFQGGRTQAQDKRVIVQGAAIAAAAVAAGQVDPNVDFWPMYSESSIDNESSHTLSGALWPGFLLDAFFWLYDYQPIERAGMGISESQWPNPPHSSYASSSGFLVTQLATGCVMTFGADTCAQFFGADPPLGGGSSVSKSAHFDSSGLARGMSINVPGVLEATEAGTTTSTKYVDGHTLVEAIFKAQDVTIGGQLHIDSIEARSVALAAGNKNDSRATSTLSVIGATLNGTPVEIDDQGFHIAGDQSTDSIDDALKEQGIEVRTSLGREKVDKTGEFVDAATGGLFIHLLRQRSEEALPQPLVAQKDAACAAAENSPLNQEITRIRVDQPNPLYGQLPLPGIPARAQLEQSIPPPFECPFLNRDFGLTLALGFTNASARLSPLAEVSGFEAPVGDIVLPTRPVTHTFFIPGTPAIAPGVVSLPQQETTLAAAPHDNGDGARRMQALYGLLLLLIALGVAGRFVLRFASRT